MYRALALYRNYAGAFWVLSHFSPIRTKGGKFYYPILITTEEKNEVLRN